MNNEALAHIVANEWLSQGDQIFLNQMHITGLCNTSIDNPGKADNKILVDSILSKFIRFKLVKRRTQFKQLFIMHLKRKKKHIFFWTNIPSSLILTICKFQ